MCVFLISPVPIAEPLTSELIDTPVFYNLAPRPIKYRVSVPIPIYISLFINLLLTYLTIFPLFLHIFFHKYNNNWPLYNPLNLSTTHTHRQTDKVNLLRMEHSHPLKLRKPKASPSIVSTTTGWEALLCFSTQRTLLHSNSIRHSGGIECEETWKG